jgi:cytochrome P450
MAEVPAHVPPDLVYPFEQIYAERFDVAPYEVLDRIRAEAPPIFYSPVTAWGGGQWYVTRAADVRAVMQEHARFTTTMGYAPGSQMARRMLPLELDPPDHAKYRHLLTPLFAPVAIDRLEASISETCNGLLDQVIERGSCEFMGEFARMMPGTVFMKLMGLPMDRRPQFFTWEEAFFHGGTDEDRRVAGLEIMEALNELIEARRDDPQEDIISLLVHNGFEDGSAVPDDDVRDLSWLLFIAGLDTVHAGLGHSFRYLAEHPDRRAALAKDPSLVPAAVEELLRWHAWVNPPRTVRVDTELSGVQMKKGEQVIMLISTANRDEKVFADADEVDFHRQSNPHFAFGGGVHRCVGSHLARRELGVAIRTWTQRAPDFHLPADGARLRYATLGMFSLPDLPLEWTPPASS